MAEASSMWGPVAVAMKTLLLLLPRAVVAKLVSLGLASTLTGLVSYLLLPHHRPHQSRYVPWGWGRGLISLYKTHLNFKPIDFRGG